jgi:hypothetical protein
MGDMEINGKDEIQLSVADKDVEAVMKICVDIAPLVGEYLNLRCPIAAEAKSGSSWSSTH